MRRATPSRSAFGMIFDRISRRARADMRKSNKNLRFLQVFMFSRCRLFFARVGLLVRRSIGNTLKSTPLSSQNRSQSEQNRSREPAWSHFGRLRAGKRESWSAGTLPRASQSAQSERKSAQQSIPDPPNSVPGARGPREPAYQALIGIRIYVDMFIYT